MHTVALAPRRDVEKAASEARASMITLMAAIDGRDLAQTVKASEKAYLAVGLLLALSRAAESH